MIDEKAVASIRAHGAFRDSGEGRVKVLADDIGFRMDEKAEYVLIGGCLQPEDMPHVFRALKGLLDRLQVDYTTLAREYCCGWVPLGQPAVMAKNEADIASAKELAEEFILENFRQAEALGARSIALFSYTTLFRPGKLMILGNPQRKIKGNGFGGNGQEKTQ